MSLIPHEQYLPTFDYDPCGSEAEWHGNHPLWARVNVS